MAWEAIQRWFCSGADFCITKVLKQHWYKNKYSYRSAPRPDHGFLLLVSGRVDFITEGRALCAHAGNLVFLPKGSRYEAVFKDTAEDYLVSFDAVCEEVLPSDPILLFDAAPLPCVERMRLILEENKYEMQSKLYNKGLLYLLLSSIVSADREGNDAKDLVVKRAIERMRQDRGATVESIARECAVSPSTLRHYFTEKLGVSPMRYWMNMRLRQAAYLIESTDLTVNEIAARLSFFDAAHFCKVFREYTGMTPRQYAKNKRI